ncbi:MAG: DUF4652 domain-containing protein, partial [Clostridiaceae bacterium]|nr:DUF4652 domain-containing protein [Clostridiaceae bacterium]
MNCDTFHRKIEDLLDEDCLMDFKNSMEEHRDNCASCKAIYEEELEIQKDFKEFFSIKDIEFKSSRTEIINAINKNQYKNNYLIQIYTHLNRHKNRYMTCAAAFIMLFLVAPNISKLFGFEQLNSDLFKFSSFKSSSSSASATTSMPSQDLAMSYDSGLGNSAVAKSNNVQETNNITFKKLEMDRGYKVIPRDTWKTSSNGKYSACVDGGTKNTVLGIRKIYVKENTTEKLWSFTINNNLDPLNTPLFLEWSQKDKMFMVIVGKATGTITEGGDIYVLNVD